MKKTIMLVVLAASLSAGVGCSSSEERIVEAETTTVGPFTIEGERNDGRYTAHVSAAGVAPGPASERPDIEIDANGIGTLRRAPTEAQVSLDPALPLADLNRAALRAWLEVEVPQRDSAYGMVCTFGEVANFDDPQSPLCGGCCWQTDCLSSHIDYVSRACTSYFF